MVGRGFRLSVMMRRMTRSERNNLLAILAAIILIIGAVAAYPLGADLGNKLLKKKSKVPVYLSIVWFAVLLILCIAGMMSSTYSTFLYFQF